MLTDGAVGIRCQPMYLRVAAKLAVGAAACVALLAVASNAIVIQRGAYAPNPRYVGQLIGTGLTVFVMALIGAGIAALITRKNPIARERESSLVTWGLVLAAMFTGMVYLGSAG